MRPRGAGGASAYETPTIAPRDERERTAAPAAEPALTAVDISRSFGGVRALDGVNFNVTHGTIHGLIGPNGSGKTTFFDILCGFLPPTDGHIDAAVPGVARLGAYRRARSGLGRTFQLPNVLVHNTVLDNVLLGIMASMPRRSRLLPVGRGNRTEWEKRANAALEEVGMASMSDRVLGDLPYGSQRIVDLARVLAARPSLVLLDEPGAGMSGAERELIKQIVLSLRDRGTTIVVVEHDMRFIMEICDRITVLATGQVIADGTPAEIGADEEVIAAYLGEAYVAS
jgi:ABC-type branched-subunit amino acid transport system ATPase component